MSLLTTKLSNGGNPVQSSFTWSELNQLLLSLSLVAVYLTQSIMHLGNEQFTAGALVSIVSYYFGGKSTVAGSVAASTAATTAINNSNGTTTTS